MSYKSKDRLTGELFQELLPYGGQLNPANRWMRLSLLVPWEKLEEIYRKYFSTQGRPGKDSRLLNGLLIAKHLGQYSDTAIVAEFDENVYLQYFCGYAQFVQSGAIEASTISKLRKRLGVEYFQRFEGEILQELLARKIIKSKEQMIDATVFPANISYPTDSGLIEKARRWVVQQIKEVRQGFGIKAKIRTYCQKAKKTFLKFQKKGQKKVKEIRRVNRQLLNYLRRNIGQLKSVLAGLGELPIPLRNKFKRGIVVAEEIYRQQLEMLQNKSHRVKDRIVSFHRAHIRPIVRGKNGKEVEFGPKCTLSYVDGYTFLDALSFNAFNEANLLSRSIELHRQRFGVKPQVVITDKLYGNRENRELLQKEKIRGALYPLGRRKEEDQNELNWIKQKQRKRNRIEGAIGNSKNNYGLDKIWYAIDGGEEIWIRLGLMAMNLSTANGRIG